MNEVRHSRMKFPLGTDLKSGSPALILSLNISVGKAKLNQDHCLGATLPYTCTSRRGLVDRLDYYMGLWDGQ